jgi:hypothetical protein
MPPLPLRRALPLLAALLLAGCAVERREAPPPRRPADIRAQLLQLLPPALADRDGWATDILASFQVLQLDASPGNLCAVLAVAEQESTFRVDPPVPNLPKIAWGEIEKRAGRLGVPMLLVRGALSLDSPTGKSYAERIDHVKTERELNDVFEDFIGMVPMGRRLFSDYNPVRTAGPMQVAVAFAEAQVKAKPYPYPMTTGGVRREVFTRRGGLYFGIAHLLDYPAPYDQPIYRFADFNAGRWASRNAAFQQAVTQATGVPLVPDGDLVLPGAPADQPGATETAVRVLAPQLDMTPRQIHAALALGDSADFERSTLYRRVYEIAERTDGRPLPRAALPRIELHSPKITRQLTTEWFARRVNERHQRCMARASASQ